MSNEQQSQQGAQQGSQQESQQGPQQGSQQGSQQDLQQQGQQQSQQAQQAEGGATDVDGLADKKPEELTPDELRLMADTMPGEGPGD